MTNQWDCSYLPELKPPDSEEDERDYLTKLLNAGTILHPAAYATFWDIRDTTAAAATGAMPSDLS